VHRPVKTKKPDGLTNREGLNLAGSGDPAWTGTGVDAERPSLVQSHRGRDRALRYPSGLSGTAGRGPACPVVWEPGGAIPPATRLAVLLIRDCLGQTMLFDFTLWAARTQQSQRLVRSESINDQALKPVLPCVENDSDHERPGKGADLRELLARYR
jgi:hypothetical protein